MMNKSKTNGRLIGEKVATAEFCWNRLTNGGDTEEMVAEAILLQAMANLTVEERENQGEVAMVRKVVRHAWLEGFIACLSAMEFGAIQQLKPEKLENN
jgi:hypothetical protein